MNAWWPLDEPSGNTAFETVLGRPPSDKELARSRPFLEQQAALYAKASTQASPAEEDVPPSKDPALRARESLVHALFNYNDFVTVR